MIAHPIMSAARRTYRRTYGGFGPGTALKGDKFRKRFLIHLSDAWNAAKRAERPPAQPSPLAEVYRQLALLSYRANYSDQHVIRRRLEAERDRLSTGGVS